MTEKTILYMSKEWRTPWRASETFVPPVEGQTPQLEDHPISARGEIPWEACLRWSSTLAGHGREASCLQSYMFWRSEERPGELVERLYLSKGRHHEDRSQRDSIRAVSLTHSCFIFSNACSMGKFFNFFSIKCVGASRSFPPPLPFLHHALPVYNSNL